MTHGDERFVGEGPGLLAAAQPRQAIEEAGQAMRRARPVLRASSLQISNHRSGSPLNNRALAWEMLAMPYSKAS